MDNLASGNNTFDNDSNILYVSFVRETFLYLLMSVISVSFHINNPYIGDIIGLSMKILLTLILCSYTQSVCMDPYPWPKTFNTMYDCMMAGYEESQEKMKEIGSNEVNKHEIYIKFTCVRADTV